MTENGKPTQIDTRTTINVVLAITLFGAVYYYADQNATQRTELKGLLALRIDQRLGRIEAKLGIPVNQAASADRAPAFALPQPTDMPWRHPPETPRRAVANDR